MLFALSQEQSNSSPSSADKDVTFGTTMNSQKDAENSGHVAEFETSKVIVEIHSDSQSFTIQELSQLSYFKARFSSRWLKNISNQKKFNCFHQTTTTMTTTTH